MNIAGNFNTEEEEVSTVKKLLDSAEIKYNDIYKSTNLDNEDVIVIINDRKISIEVKQEGYTRFKKYGDLGMDCISSFTFKQGVMPGSWKGSPKSPSLISNFEKSIVIQKMGKIYYSKADTWLFYSSDNNGVLYSAWFLGEDMTSNYFKDYLRNNCVFAVNNKSEWQLSNSDRHESATFFINSKDKVLLSFKKNIKEIFE